MSPTGHKGKLRRGKGWSSNSCFEIIGAKMIYPKRRRIDNTDKRGGGSHGRIKRREKTSLKNFRKVETDGTQPQVALSLQAGKGKRTSQGNQNRWKRKRRQAVVGGHFEILMSFRWVSYFRPGQSGALPTIYPYFKEVKKKKTGGSSGLKKGWWRGFQQNHSSLYIKWRTKKVLRNHFFALRIVKGKPGGIKAGGKQEKEGKN